MTQWLSFIYEHPDPIIVAREDNKLLHTNKKCRTVFRPPEDLELPKGIDPSNPEKQNDWILNKTGRL